MTASAPPVSTPDDFDAAQVIVAALIAHHHGDHVGADLVLRTYDPYRIANAALQLINNLVADPVGYLAALQQFAATNSAAELKRATGAPSNEGEDPHGQ